MFYGASLYLQSFLVEFFKLFTRLPMLYMKKNSFLVHQKLHLSFHRQSYLFL